MNDVGPSAGGRPRSRGRERWWIRAQNALTLAALAFGPLFSPRTFPAGQIAAGVLLCALGAAAGLLGVRALGRNRSPHPNPPPSAELIQHGIYAVVRHPLYLSLMLVTAGWSLGWGSWPGLAASAGLALLLDRKARAEEEHLRRRFPGYARYASSVRRFIPGLY